jgi:hypothetical protein
VASCVKSAGSRGPVEAMSHGSTCTNCRGEGEWMAGGCSQPSWTGECTHCADAPLSHSKHTVFFVSLCHANMPCVFLCPTNMLTRMQHIRCKLANCALLTHPCVPVGSHRNAHTPPPPPIAPTHAAGRLQANRT